MNFKYVLCFLLTLPIFVQAKSKRTFSNENCQIYRETELGFYEKGSEEEAFKAALRVDLSFKKIGKHGVFPVFKVSSIDQKLSKNHSAQLKWDLGGGSLGEHGNRSLESRWTLEKRGSSFHLKPVGFLRTSHFLYFFAMGTSISISYYDQDGKEVLSSEPLRLSSSGRSLKNVAYSSKCGYRKLWKGRDSTSGYGLANYYPLLDALDASFVKKMDAEISQMSSVEAISFMEKILNRFAKEKNFTKAGKKKIYRYIWGKKGVKQGKKWIKIDKLKKQRASSFNRVAKKFNADVEVFKREYDKLIKLSGGVPSDGSARIIGEIEALKKNQESLVNLIGQLSKDLSQSKTNDSETATEIEEMRVDLKGHNDIIYKEFDSGVQQLQGLIVRSQDNIQHLKSLLKNYQNWLSKSQAKEFANANKKSRRQRKSSISEIEKMSYKQVLNMAGEQKQRYLRIRIIKDLREHVISSINQLDELSQIHSDLRPLKENWMVMAQEVEKAKATISYHRQGVASMFKSIIEKSVYDDFANLNQQAEAVQGLALEERSPEREAERLSQLLGGIDGPVQSYNNWLANNDGTLIAKILCRPSTSKIEICLSPLKIGHGASFEQFFAQLPDDNAELSKKSLAEEFLNTAAIGEAKTSYGQELVKKMAQELENLDLSDLRKNWTAHLNLKWRLKIVNNQKAVAWYCNDLRKKAGQSKLTASECLSESPVLISEAFYARIFKGYQQKMKRHKKAIQQMSQDLNQKSNLLEQAKNQLDQKWVQSSDLSQKIYESTGKKIEKLSEKAKLPSFFGHCSGKTFAKIADSKGKCKEHAKDQSVQLSDLRNKEKEKYAENILFLKESIGETIQQISQDHEKHKSRMNDLLQARKKYVNENGVEGKFRLFGELNDKKEKLESQIESLEKALSTNRSESTNNQSKMKTLEEQKSELFKKVQRLRTPLENTQFEINKVCRELKKIRKDIEEMEKEIKTRVYKTENVAQLKVLQKEVNYQEKACQLSESLPKFLVQPNLLF